ncbi:MAG: MFS transporter [Bacteroidota bacterium]
MRNTFQALQGFINRPVFPLLLINFIGALGYSIILPFLVYLVLDFGGNEILYGLMAATYPLFQMFGAPMLGSWSDRIGRKKVLMISQAGTLLSWLVFLMAFLVPVQTIFSISTAAYGLISITIPLFILMGARALDGLTGGNISVANAYLSDISTDEDRKQNFGQMSAAMNLGFILGPVIAGFLSSFESGKLFTVILAAVVSIIGLLTIYFFLPETKINPEVETCPEEKLKKVLVSEHKECYPVEGADEHSFRSVLRQDRAPLMLVLYFLIFLAFNVFYATFPVYASSTLSWSPQTLGTFFTVLSTSMILMQGPGLARLSKRFDELQLYWAGTLVMTLTFFVFTLPWTATIYLGAMLYGIGNGMMWPSYMAMLSRIGSPSKQGRLQGLANSMGSLASIIGLLTGGLLLSFMGSSVYFLPAGVLILILIISFRMPDQTTPNLATQS